MGRLIPRRAGDRRELDVSPCDGLTSRVGADTGSGHFGLGPLVCSRGCCPLRPGGRIFLGRGLRCRDGDCCGQRQCANCVQVDSFHGFLMVRFSLVFHLLLQSFSDAGRSSAVSCANKPRRRKGRPGGAIIHRALHSSSHGCRSGNRIIYLPSTLCGHCDLIILRRLL